jgi:exoribonuclease R
MTAAASSRAGAAYAGAAMYGVLIVDGITYGRLNNKLLYKCIPDDSSLAFSYILVPYEEKNTTFSKVKVNKYVSVSVKDTDAISVKDTDAISVKDTTRDHPIGMLLETFGDVDDLEAYIQYRMACKNMSHGLKPLTTAVIRSSREKCLSNISAHYNIEDRRDYPIFSIDPLGCRDIDDAMGIRLLPDGQTLLSIYISNVPLVIDYLNLWENISERISTVYLPHKKIPMLPVILSENMCSLLEGQERVAFVMDVYTYAGAVKQIKLTNALIRVEKNYEYEAPALVARLDYKKILAITKQLNQDSFHYLEYVDDIKDSHDVVEFCMIFMNHECAKKLQLQQRGIFRSATKKEIQPSNEEDYKKVLIMPELIYMLQGVAGEYCLVDNIKPHELIGKGLKCYTHITSPIRRLVDIVNMVELQTDTCIGSVAADAFLKKWKTPQAVETINQKTKAIRRLQNDVELLHVYEKYGQDKVYSGIILGVPPPHDGSNMPSPPPQVGGSGGRQPPTPTRVYIPELKLLTKLKSAKELPIYSLVECTVHLFLDEAKMRRKVRLQML